MSRSQADARLPGEASVIRRPRVRCVVMLPLLTLVLAVSIAPDAVPTPPPAPPNGTPGR